MKKILAILILILGNLSLYATHNRAGQIVYKHLHGYTYQVTIWTYTYSLSQADRDSLEIHWGDGTSKWLPRVQKTYLPDYYIENKYVGVHTYPGPGTFKLYMEDPNRNDGVLNIPNSVNTVFALTTTLQINPFLGNNNAAILTTRPIDKAAKHQLFIHNPGAYDPDGDSLVYKMDTCRYTDGKKIPGFSLPPATDSIYVNPITGDLIWDTPPQVGIYNVAMRIEEWRKGIKISQIIRDIQIEVVESDNHRPRLDTLPDFCILAGDSISFTVTAHDQDNDMIYLTSAGGPFWIDDSPATFPDSVHGLGTVSGVFSWQTNCHHVLASPYTATFKATDDNPVVHLVDYISSHIRVIGPPVQFTSVYSSNNNVVLKWEHGACDYIKGYKLYRKNDTENFTIDSCTTGVPPSWGYQLIATLDSGVTQYVDKNLTPGFVYCYRVVPLYNNGVEGITSDKECVEIAKGFPILTKSSVLRTAKDTGAIRVEWITPVGFDTTTYGGPYRYLLSVSRDLYGVNFGSPIVLNGLNDTTFIDSLIDTKTTASCYKLAFQYTDSAGNYTDIGDASIASSPFLKIYSSDRENTLKVEANVPWENYKYIIYRFNNNTQTWDSIATVDTNIYIDNGLVNEVEYCYRVKTIGKYTATDVPQTIINYSQIECGTPIDTIPPCCPVFKVTSNCDNFTNTISWYMPEDSCKEGLANYKIYYSDTQNGEPQLIATVSGNDSVYTHSPQTTLAGCYYVSAIDSTGNESQCADNIQCVDVCEYYKLPNVFTPNGDNINDLFHPYPYSFVDHIDLKIYNRWGNLVYQTDDPDINWDGKDMNTGKLVPEGVYYYICDVYEYRLNGIQPRNISGFIHVEYGKNQNTN